MSLQKQSFLSNCEGWGLVFVADINDPLKDIQLGDVVVSNPNGSYGKHPASPVSSVVWIRSFVWWLNFELNANSN